MTVLLPFPSIDPAFTATSDGYTPGIAFTVKWSPVFQNETQIAQSGAAITVGLSPWPLHQFELNYEVLRDLPGVSLEFKRVLGFYNFMQGSLGRFGFNWPDDNKVIGQLLGAGDGVKTTFTFVRSFGDPNYPAVGDQLAEPIGDFNSAVQPLNVYLNGVLQTSGFTIGGTFGMNTLTFSTPPAGGVLVTADFGYRYYCRFAEDQQPFEKFSNGRWQAMSLKIISCRANA